MAYDNIGIAYVTNPAIEAEPFGKEVEGIMVSVAKQVPVRKVDTYKDVTMVEEMKPQNLPSLVFTEVNEQVAAIDRYNKTGKV